MFLEKKLKRHPFILSLCLIGFVVLIHKIPFVKEDYLGITISNLISVSFLFFIAKLYKFHLMIDSFKIGHIKFYIPLFLYVLIFSNFFNDFVNFSFSEVSIKILILYTLKIFTSAYLEEILFRGLILAIFLNYFLPSKNGLFKAVLLSSLMFGLTHIINIWTTPEQEFNTVLNQIYATMCLGVMYGATYIRTQNILLIGFFHSLSNFFAMISELKVENHIEVFESYQEVSFFNLLLSQILKIIIFGIPLVIGCFLICHISKTEFNKIILNFIPR